MVPIEAMMVNQVSSKIYDLNVHCICGVTFAVDWNILHVVVIAGKRDASSRRYVYHMPW